MPIDGIYIAIDDPLHPRSPLMNAVDLIAHDATELPEALQAEVLDFIGCLKTRHPQAPAAAASDAKLSDLMAFFAPYRKDFGSFFVDRDEANAR